MKKNIPAPCAFTRRGMVALMLSAVSLLAAPTWGQVDTSKIQKEPPYPEIPRNFVGAGRYIVRDLDVDVPFTWEGKDGNWQMIAGGRPEDKIHFTNLMYMGYLYTYTYKWPGLPPVLLPPHEPCDPIDPNSLVADVPRFVGAEILVDKWPWSTHLVNHWRVGIGFRTSGDRLDLPIMLGDVYVDHDDPGRIRKILHFGLQNFYDPAKDEWIVMDAFSRRRAGRVTLPGACKLPPCYPDCPPPSP